MPRSAPTICTQVGCNTLVATPGRCQKHRSEANHEYNVQRTARQLDTDRWYHTSRWQKLRASVIAVEPLCRHCVAAGRVTLAGVVDHIQPVRFEGEFWDRTNLQPLCNPCHEAKSTAEGSRSRHPIRGPRVQARQEVTPTAHVALAESPPKNFA
jgi:5-methylcytosine-specific restriction enzyme A